MQRLFERFDATPTMTAPPKPLDAGGSIATEMYAEWAAPLYPFNLTGHPALSAPAGFSTGGPSCRRPADRSLVCRKAAAPCRRPIGSDQSLARAPPRTDWSPTELNVLSPAIEVRSLSSRDRVSREILHGRAFDVGLAGFASNPIEAAIGISRRKAADAWRQTRLLNKVAS